MSWQKYYGVVPPELRADGDDGSDDVLLFEPLVLGLADRSVALELLVLDAGCSAWDELVEPVLLVEPVALMLPLLVDVSLVAVVLVSVSVLLLRVSRLQLDR